MSKNYLYLIPFIASALFFYKGIPLDTMHAHSTLLVLIGGILTAFLLALAIYKIYVPILIKRVDQKEDPIGCTLMVLVVVFFFGYSAFLIFNEVKQTANEISQHGEYTTGIIVDGSSYATRRADFTNVTLKYKTKEGKEYTTVQDISKQEFERYSQFQEVPMVYSKNYPTLLEILRTDAAIAKYSKTKVRDLKLSDLLTIIEMNAPIEINTLLNSINQKWTYDNGGEFESNVFYNNFKHIAIKKTGQQELAYMHYEVNRDLFATELKALHFEQVDGLTNAGLIYTNGSFIVNIRIERIREDEENSFLNFRQVTLVAVAKVKK